jgi:hypothetical protein
VSTAAARLAALLAGAAMASGCLVLDLHPAYDPSSMAFEPALVGSWEDADDDVTVLVERGEWNSYRIHYVHPIEEGNLTGYLTQIGSERLLDVMPVKGEHRGSFLVPVHAALRVRLEGDTLSVWPLSYEYFRGRLEAGSLPGLTLVLDGKENVLVTSPTAALRRWFARQPAASPAIGPEATFRRVR